jgi:hypothetical protein
MVLAQKRRSFTTGSVRPQAQRRRRHVACSRGDRFPQQSAGGGDSPYPTGDSKSSNYQPHYGDYANTPQPGSYLDNETQPSAPQSGGYGNIDVQPPSDVKANNIGLRVGAAYVLTLAITYSSNLGLIFGNTNQHVCSCLCLSTCPAQASHRHARCGWRQAHKLLALIVPGQVLLHGRFVTPHKPMQMLGCACHALQYSSAASRHEHWHRSCNRYTKHHM